MPDWLADVPADAMGITLKMLAVRLFCGLIFGCLIALVYRVTHGRDKAEAHIMETTLVLLCLLISLVSMVIGNNVARAFSLVGALSIVRFRTVVDDTRDTAFVIFSVIVGMAVGAGQFLVPIAGIPSVALAAIGLYKIGKLNTNGFTGILTVRVGLGRDPEALLAVPFGARVQSRRLVSVGTAKQGAALELAYSVRIKSDEELTKLVTDLNSIEGVQAVEVKKGD